MPDLTPDEAVASVTRDYPGLRQVHPLSPGQPLTSVQLDSHWSARFMCDPYRIVVTVGGEDYLNRESPADHTLYRSIRAYAVLLADRLEDAPNRGGYEWERASDGPEIYFPTAVGVGVEDTDDPRFAAAVVATVARALDYAQSATRRVNESAARLQQDAQWERERPPGKSRAAWLQQKRREAREASSSDRSGS